MRTLLISVAVCLLASCAIVSLSVIDLTISIAAEFGLPPEHVFRVEVAGESHEVQAGTQGHIRYAIDRHAPRTGTLQVRATLLNAARATVAATSFSQSFQKDSDHWVSAWVGRQRPIGHCIGSLLATPLVPQLSSAGGDTLFVMFGSIPKGAVC